MTTRIRPFLHVLARLAIGLAAVLIASAVSAAKADHWQLSVRTAKPIIGAVPIVREVSPSLPQGDYVLEVPGLRRRSSSRFSETRKSVVGHRAALGTDPGSVLVAALFSLGSGDPNRIRAPC